MRIFLYKTTCLVNGKFYIGSSKNIEKRWYTHRRDFKTHKNQSILQRAWNKHGSDKFTFEIIEECANDQKICFEREQYYLDLLKPYLAIGYNIETKASGGDTFTLNPNKEAIREKMRILNAGDKNGMFGRTHNDSTKNEMKNKAKGRFSLEWFIERNGEELESNMSYSSTWLCWYISLDFYNESKTDGNFIAATPHGQNPMAETQ